MKNLFLSLEAQRHLQISLPVPWPLTYVTLGKTPVPSPASVSSFANKGNNSCLRAETGTQHRENTEHRAGDMKLLNKCIL